MFKVNQKIAINGKSFEITKITDSGTKFEMLFGTCEGDPSFLSGKRSVAVHALVGKNGKYKYSW